MLSNELLYWIFPFTFYFWGQFLGTHNVFPHGVTLRSTLCFIRFYSLQRTYSSYYCGPLAHFTECLVKKMSKFYINLSYFCFLCFPLYLKLHLLSDFHYALSFIGRLIFIQKIDIDIKYLSLWHWPMKTMNSFTNVIYHCIFLYTWPYTW